MNKKLEIGLIAIVTLVFLFCVAGIIKFNFTDSDVFMENRSGEVSPQIQSYDATYRIDGQNVTLINGRSSVPVAPGSASMVTTQYFGNDVKADFNGDGKEDTAFLLTQETGGSGTFFYVVAYLNNKIGTDAVFLGDRIAPQTMNVEKGNILVVNYAERNPGESFAVQPSLGKSLYLKLDPKTLQFGEVVQNFEGEADASVMTLGMKTWNWIRTTYTNDTEIVPRVSNKFTLTFKDNKTFSATTDCNSVGGEYFATGNKITFSKMMSTLMYCGGSQESDFTKMLTETQTFQFTGKGELVLGLKNDSGSVVFK